MIERLRDLRLFLMLGIVTVSLIGGFHIWNVSSQPPVKVNAGKGESFVLGAEELDPNMPVNISLHDAVRAVEAIWPVPTDARSLRSWLVRDNFAARIYWDIDWEGEEISDSNGAPYDQSLLWAQVDAETGEVFYLWDRRNQAKVDNLQDAANAVDIALPVLDKIGIDQKTLMEPRVDVLKSPSEGPDQEITYFVTWRQVHEGITVDSGWVLVFVNPKTMKLCGFNKHIIAVESVDTTPKVTREEAIRTAEKLLAYEAYKVKETINCQLIIDRPNYFWAAKRPVELGAPTLIWSVTLNCTYPEGWTEPVLVWVNAYDASIEGGSTYC